MTCFDYLVELMYCCAVCIWSLYSYIYHKLFLYFFLHIVILMLLQQNDYLLHSGVINDKTCKNSVLLKYSDTWTLSQPKGADCTHQKGFVLPKKSCDYTPGSLKKFSPPTIL